MLVWPSLSVEVTFSMKSNSSLLSSMLPRSKVERSARIGYWKRVTNKDKMLQRSNMGWFARIGF